MIKLSDKCFTFWLTPSIIRSPFTKILPLGC